MDRTLRQFVRDRAFDRCEYCKLPQAALSFVRFHVDHVVSRSHGGSDLSENLALACERCNAFKGTNLAGIDPDTGLLERLFHPRRDVWIEHFIVEVEWDSALIFGLDAIGRTTVEVLAMNEPKRVQFRRHLIELGEF